MLSWVWKVVVAVGCVPLLAMAFPPEPHDQSYPYFPNCGGTKVNMPYANPPNSEGDGSPIIGMMGTCGVPSGPAQCTWFHLNRCYVNSNGSLVPVSDGSGNFWDTCTSCTTNDITNPGFMYCSCQNDDKTWVPAQTDLRDHILVDGDGILGCPMVKGESCLTGW